MKPLLLEILEDRTVPSAIIHAVWPWDTDPEIAVRPGRHFSYLDPEAASAGKLFVFLPGTGATPGVYRLILDTAASLGYHALGLAYVNDRAVNEICRGGPKDCQRDVRMEILDGTDRTDLVAVDRPNSVENRLLRVLQYLEANYPEEGWGQFLNGEEFRWETMMFAGHSQGGGHAAILGKLHALYRVGMFNATEPAEWTEEPLSETPTPPDRYYGIAHTRESAFLPFVLSWLRLGLPGDLADVDGAEPPYGDARMLMTSVAAPPARYHGVDIVDSFTPVLEDGTPLFRPVWTYLINPWGSGPAPHGHGEGGAGHFGDLALVCTLLSQEETTRKA